MELDRDALLVPVMKGVVLQVDDGTEHHGLVPQPIVPYGHIESNISVRSGLAGVACDGAA